MKESIKPNRRQSLLQFKKYESQLQSVGVFGIILINIQ